MANKKKTTWLIGTGLIGLLCVTSACGNTPKKQAGEGVTEDPTQQAGNNNKSPLQQPGESGQGKVVVATKCEEVPVEDCEKTLFGEKRCKKDGEKCVEDTSTKAPEACGDLSEDDCNKSLVCTYDSSECKEDPTYLVAPCKDKEVKDCKDECRVDTVLPVCLKNERSGRCVFDVTRCVVDVGDCKHGFGGLCRKVEEATGGECKLDNNVCALLNSGNGAVTGPTGVKLTTSDANDGDTVAVQANGVQSAADARTSVALCIGDPGHANENDRAIPNPLAANACQDIFGKELADILQKNQDDAGTYDERAAAYPAICSSLEIEGAVAHADGSANEVRADGGDDGNFSVHGANMGAGDIDEGDDVNVAGWCHWHSNAVTVLCEVHKVNLNASTLCKKGTKLECEGVPEPALGVGKPCKWEE